MFVAAFANPPEPKNVCAEETTGIMRSADAITARTQLADCRLRIFVVMINS
jgi:hypothetical protein